MPSDAEWSRAGLRRVDTPHAQGTALDLGATVLSWQPAGQDEVFFVSRAAQVGPGLELHGGVPVCAPWFGRGRPGIDVPHPHGLVRWLPWRLVSAGHDELIWEVTGDELTHIPGADRYPSDMIFQLRAIFATQLRIELTVISPTTGFILDEALHAYFRVSDLTSCQLLGLELAVFRDFAASGEPQVAGEPLRIRGRMDRVYASGGPVVLLDGERRVELLASGADSTVVWNPGPGPQLAGLAPDEWRRMLCIEVGNVQDRAVWVPAGGSHRLGLLIRVSAGR
ncbi:MAG: hypothetical protein Q4D79_00365 [Propionibacteriaceae bacterium]|nr:hypothetical protein [Propionibacteriaceae bacterium]